MKRIAVMLLVTVPMALFWLLFVLVYIQIVR